MITIVQNGDPVLRGIAKEVPLSDITKPKIGKIISDMSEALIREWDGVAIAAPQIGIALRIFVISGRVFDEDYISGAKPGKENLHKKHLHPNLIFINPIIQKISKDKKLMPEGCLSVRPIYGKVRRATKVTIEAYNERGVKFVIEGTGLLAHIFQHECDHLEGILFIDKARDLHEVPLDQQEYK